MTTIYEIAQHVVTGKPYVEKPYQAGQESKAYQLLKQKTTPDIVQIVRDFVGGIFSQDKVESQMTSETAYRYLAAAKLVDLDTPPAKKVQSTYKIRELALLRSKPEQNGRAEITMLNAFSTPPANKDDLDVLLANELDHSHPLVKTAPGKEVRDRHLNRIYFFAQKETQLVPEMVPIIQSVIKDRFEAMLKVAASLPAETRVIFKGCAGAGKTYALKEYLTRVPGTTVEQAVLSTDNCKNEIRVRTGNIFSDRQIFLMGHAMYKMLSEVMKEVHPKLSTLEESWFNSAAIIEQLFRDLSKAGLKMEMHDFDGDYSGLCLRIVARQQDPKSPKPTLYDVENAFKSSREARNLLLKSLRATDSYQFRFVHQNGSCDERIDPASLPSDPAILSAQMEATKKMKITKQHVEIFGASLNAFVDMTIEQAFERGRA